MRSIKLTLAYDGTDYAGWQVQPGQPTVQGTLEAAIKKMKEYKEKELLKKYPHPELPRYHEEIIEEKVALESKVSPYEQILKDYPWLEEDRYEFMYSIPDHKKNPSDFESWKTEWSKVLFDYGKYAEKLRK